MSQAKFTASFEMSKNIDELFPLFSAEGEKLWVPDWDYQNIMGSTELCEDYVFVTKTHDYASGDAIWIVKSYDPKNHFVTFYKVEPEDKIATVSIKCDALTKNDTLITVSYDYVALSKRGQDFIDGYSQDIFEAFIGEWNVLLIQYFNRKD